ncbi:hypothetical protein PV327_010703 [Microctonus hyperodae]|uniref:Uncharacterized protein n=1 Tax=Microctonus hyperodae TaxID=165561 RepID=A0AA39C804_MICHY|nr:hypothetical protein PV327_010703 [Microctonus hyperodae]
MRIKMNFLLLLMAIFVSLINGELSERICPNDCHCYYSRINWVTDCSESNLTYMPYEDLSNNVYILNMNGNNIAELPPFPSNITLRRLQMAHNRLTELNYRSFAGLLFLLDADFSYNEIKYVDPEAFQDSPGLITLELQNNPLQEVKRQFLNCKTLLYLYLSNCHISKINDRFFQNITNLKRLDISNNPLQTIDSVPFEYLPHLEYLNLDNCSLTYIAPKAFINFENLCELILTNNNLTTVSWTMILSPLGRLENLDIGNSQISTLPPDAFAKNSYLRQLVLAYNKLHHFNVTNTLGHNLHNLQTLDLSHCALQDQLPEDAFKNASKLRVLKLDDNPMFVANLTAVLRHLPTLQKLSLTNCSLHRLPNAFDVLQHLQELDISHNPLSDAFVDLLNPLRSLEYLDMSHCNLGYVGNNTFAHMTELKRLILSDNKLHTLEQDLFMNLTRLESLELSNCDLRTPLDPRVFGTERIYTSIIELKLSSNPLKIPQEGALLPKQLSSVEILDLSNCSITNMNPNIFSRNRNLTRLNLSNNKLSSIDSLMFLKKLRRLEHLDLSNNNLTTINPRVFKANEHLLSLNLIGNPFICDCFIIDMWNWAMNVKHNLDVLVGSQPTDFAAGAAKLRKGLMCTLIKNGDNQQQKTWAKYIRESNCGEKLPVSLL